MLKVETLSREGQSHRPSDVASATLSTILAVHVQLLCLIPGESLRHLDVLLTELFVRVRFPPSPLSRCQASVACSILAVGLFESRSWVRLPVVRTYQLSLLTPASLPRSPRSIATYGRSQGAHHAVSEAIQTMTVDPGLVNFWLIGTGESSLL